MSEFLDAWSHLFIPMAFGAAAIGGAVWAVFWAQFGRWSFDFGGRTFTVRNHLFHEVIEVDGEVVKGTRVHATLMEADHAIALPDGRQLDIVIGSTDGFSMFCRARVGEDVIFDSKQHGQRARAKLPGALKPTPAAPTSSPEDTIDDPRWAPAQVLLDALAADPSMSASAASLREALRDALGALERSQRAAAAHQALGGSEDRGALDEVVRHRDASVEDVLGLLRELHLAATTQAPSPKVQDTLAQLKAEREVDDAVLRRAMAARAAQETRG